jgi:hypothetical protein
MPENQRGSSPISGTSRAAGGPSTVLGHHPRAQPKAMTVIPINNIRQSSHHSVFGRLIRGTVADPLLPLIQALLQTTRRRGGSVVQSQHGENERGFVPRRSRGPPSSQAGPGLVLPPYPRGLSHADPSPIAKPVCGA